MGKQLGVNSARIPNFAPRDGHRRTKYNARTKYSAFWFRGKKSTLTVKIQGWLFHMMYMNASRVGLSKKIRKICFGFWLVSVCLQKIGNSHFFAGGAWKRRRTTYADFEYKIWKVFGTPIQCKSLRCLRWWITWKFTEQKKNFKNCILGGNSMSFRDLLCVQI
jgi:hypothetical protein